MENKLLVLALAVILIQCYHAAPYHGNYMSRGNYDRYGVEGRGYGGSKSYGYNDRDDEDGYGAGSSYGSKNLYGDKSSYGDRSYEGKSYGDKIIEEVRIVKNIVIEKSPVKSYGYGSNLGSYGQNRYGRVQESYGRNDDDYAGSYRNYEKSYEPRRYESLRGYENGYGSSRNHGYSGARQY